jgi:hypothetical protein
MSGLSALTLLVAWLGASLLALSEARRGIALGLLLTGAGLTGAVLAGAGPAPPGLAGTGFSGRSAGALLLAVAAAVSALLRLRDGVDGWGLLPAGSTPGIVLSVVVLAASLLLGSTVLGGGRSSPAVAPLAVSVVAAVRLLSSRRRQVVLACASALALALGALGGTADIVAGGLVAVALSAIPGTESEEVAG